MEEQNGLDARDFCFYCEHNIPNIDQKNNRRYSDYNPWPLLVSNENLNGVITQPLVQAIYSPTSINDIFQIENNRIKNIQIHSKRSQTEEDISDFYKWFICLHESVHLWHLAWTPAKDAAKLYLAICYTCIDLLMERGLATEIDIIYNIFTEYLKQYRQIANNIRFFEELYATTYALKIVEDAVVENQIWKGFESQLKDLRTITLQMHEHDFQGLGFSDGYRNFMLPLVEATFEYPQTRIFTPLLQTIKSDGSKWYATDYEYNYNLIHDILDIAESETSLEKVMERTDELLEEVRKAWAMVLGEIIMLIQERAFLDFGNGREVHGKVSKILRYLWRISRFEYADNLSTNSYMARGLHEIQKIQNLITQGDGLVGPVHVAAIEPNIYISHKEFTSYDLHFMHVNHAESYPCREHDRVMLYEAMRQQIVAKKGFSVLSIKVSCIASARRVFTMGLYDYSSLLLTVCLEWVIGRSPAYAETIL